MTRKLAWTDEAWGDYLYWQRQDKKTLKRINKLIEATIRLPFEGARKARTTEGESGWFLIEAN
ncbi:type II toxin-antitoxin system YoeB family toxin [Microcoleus sp. B9-D4]|uniref:type II toxin-antitoxin system YoeB family toxin n=1 Tax=Microcoleus sp. B9-D4 TaxID=2818711 RepID=UPI002FD007E0